QILATRLVGMVEHLHEFAAVKDWNLRVGVLKIQMDQPQADLFGGERRGLDSRLRVQAEEGIAHRGRVTGETSTSRAVARSVAIRDRVLHGGEDDPGERNARCRGE